MVTGSCIVRDGYFNPGQVSILNRKVLTLLEDIRPNAVALVDAFDYPDQLLQSCLGRYDGQVYEALYNYEHANHYSTDAVYCLRNKIQHTSSFNQIGMNIDCNMIE
jgi:hypothetical protein